MKAGKVRPIAICVFYHQRCILVNEGYDSVKKQTFFRPLGGKIEFGEKSSETIRRELLEEIGFEVQNLIYLTTLENIFTYNGERGHEIIIVYDGEFADESVYQRAIIHGKEENHDPINAVWKPLSDFQSGSDGAASTPLYPTGLLELLLEKY